MSIRSTTDAGAQAIGPQPGSVVSSSLLMQDCLAPGGVDAAAGENRIALFANPFANGAEEALVISAEGVLTWLRRSENTGSGWEQTPALLSGTSAPVRAQEVVVVVHPFDLSVWALYTSPPGDGACTLAAARLTGTSANGLTASRWQAADPLVSPVPVVGISKLRLFYDGTTPHVFGLNPVGDHFWHIRAGSARTTVPAFEVSTPSIPVLAPGADYVGLAGPSSWTLFVQQGEDLVRIDAGGTPCVMASDVAQLVGAYQGPPVYYGGIGFGVVHLDTSGGLVTTNVLNTDQGPGWYSNVTPGLGFSTARAWADANRMLHVYGLDSVGTLQVLHQSSWANGGPAWSQTSTATGAPAPMAVRIRPGVLEYALDPFPDSLPNQLIRQDDASAANQWCVAGQDLLSARWSQESVRLPVTDAPAPVTHYVSDITLLDTAGVAMPGRTLNVSAQSRVELVSDGVSYLVGPERAARLTTNALGRITVATAARSLAPPALRVDAPGLADGVSVQQASGVHGFLSGTGSLASRDAPFSGASLLAARTDAGPVVAPGTTSQQADGVVAAVRNALAAGTGQPLTARPPGSAPGRRSPVHGCAVGRLPRTGLGYVEFATPDEARAYLAAVRALPEYGGIWEEFADFASDVWEGIRNGVIEVCNAFVTGDVGKVFILLGEKIVELADFAIDDFDSAVHLAEAALRTVVQDIGRVADWLKAVFDFGDIWDTKKALESATSEVMPLCAATFRHFEGLADDWFSGRRAEVTAEFTALKERFAQSRAGDFANVQPLPATAAGTVPAVRDLTQDPQAAWLLNRVIAASGVPGAAFPSPAADSPLTAAFDEFRTKVDATSLVADLTAALGDVAAACAALFDPADPGMARTTAVAGLLEALEQVALAALDVLDALVDGLLSVLADMALGFADLLSVPLDLGPVNTLYTWVQTEAGIAVPEPLTVGGMSHLVGAFFLTTTYKVFHGADSAPFPGGVFPALPVPPWQSGGVPGEGGDAVGSAADLHRLQAVCAGLGILDSIASLYGDLAIMWESRSDCVGTSTAVIATAAQVFSGVIGSVPPVAGRAWAGPASGALTAQAAQVCLSGATLYAHMAGDATADTAWFQNLSDGKVGPVLTTTLGLVQLVCLAADDSASGAGAYGWAVDVLSCISGVDSVLRLKTTDADESFPVRVGATAALNVLTNLSGTVMGLTAALGAAPAIDFDPGRPFQGTVGRPVTGIDISRFAAGGDQAYNSPLDGYAFSGPAVPGLAVDPHTGQVTGTPTTAGTFSVAFTVSDSSAPPLTSVPAVTQFVITAP
ncbi:hypothetical protein ABZW32_24615 [Streptomyces sp. NPDC004667]|uniref:hypothetical protein n=1 Tax=Streptomyces sp. NPDC004667 TaxID=3154285 RepID=UPI0033AC4E16